MTVCNEMLLLLAMINHNAIIINLCVTCVRVGYLKSYPPAAEQVGCVFLIVLCVNV